MKKNGFKILTSGLMLLGTFALVTDAYAYEDTQLFAPPSEQVCYHMSNANSAEKPALSSISEYTGKNYISPQVRARKEEILKKIENIRNNQKDRGSANCISLKDSPQNLFTLTRLLDFSPHPRTENILKDSPVSLNQNKYHFTVTYNEGWKNTSSESTALMESICFGIKVYENGNQVRDLTTPKVKVSKQLKKGQTIGIAEIAPFKFTIKVDDIKTTEKGVSTLQFKLDLVG